MLRTYDVRASCLVRRCHIIISVLRKTGIGVVLLSIGDPTLSKAPSLKHVLWKAMVEGTSYAIDVATIRWILLKEPAENEKTSRTEYQIASPRHFWPNDP